jgi:hypothetical protein
MDTKLEEAKRAWAAMAATREPFAVRFSLGAVAMTPAAMETLHLEDVADAIRRHGNGDWGECGPEDCRENDFALPRRLRLLSVYRDRNGTKFWIITEADRSVTTVLLPDDY